jgi:hypothetical protein
MHLSQSGADQKLQMSDRHDAGSGNLNCADMILVECLYELEASIFSMNAEILHAVYCCDHKLC